MVSIESIKEFNTRLSQHKASAQRVQTQLELMQNDLKTKLANLSNTVGRELNESNIEQYYEEVKASLEKQLANGCEILDRIEGKVAPEAVVTQQYGMPMQAQPQMVGQPVAAPMTSSAYQQPMQAAPAYQQPVQAAPVVAPATAQPVQAAPVISTIPTQMPQVAASPVYPSAPAVAMPAQSAPVAAPPQVQTVGNMEAQQGVPLSSFGVLGV